MATIEPRLMHLLNDPKAVHLSDDSPLLPPLQHFSYAKAGLHSVSLPSLGLELNGRADQLVQPQPQQQKQPHVLQASQQIRSLSSVSGKDLPTIAPRPPKQTSSYPYDGLARLKSTNHSLRALLEDDGIGTGSSGNVAAGLIEPSCSLRMILDDHLPEHSVTEDSSSKKRHRALTVKEDFVQLPQPLKKQKSAQQVMPPIINGLHEPPPNAAVFPPMASVDFGNKESMSLNLIKEYNAIPEDRTVPSSSVTSIVPISAPSDDKSTKPKRRATKPRRKWTELETNHLLLGVSRHGVGKWTSILEDQDFHFNDRTAGDLKDRFRTCCPDELRANTSSAGSRTKTPPGDKPAASPQVPGPAAAQAPSQGATLASATPSSDAKLKVKPSLMLETILIGDDDADQESAPLSSASLQGPDADTAAPKPAPRKSRAHRKKLEDLVELGICGPFKKSHRRERRPFTEQDDKQILEGIHQYGPAWTKIQRDENYNLSSRQPTDLRDRVRNKYPEIYAKIEKAGFQTKDSNSHRGNSLLEPIVNTTIEYSLNASKSSGGPLEPHLHRPASKENIPKWPLIAASMDPSETGVAATAAASMTGGHAAYDLNEHSNATYMGNVGWMDISRLLLNDDQLSSADR